MIYLYIHHLDHLLKICAKSIPKMEQMKYAVEENHI